MENISKKDNLTDYYLRIEPVLFNTNPLHVLTYIDSLLKQIHSEIKKGKVVELRVIDMLTNIRKRIINHIDLDKQSQELLLPLRKAKLADLKNCDFANNIIIPKSDDETYAATIYSLIDDINVKANEALRLEMCGNQDEAIDAEQIVMIMHAWLSDLLEKRPIASPKDAPKQLVKVTNQNKLF